MQIAATLSNQVPNDVRLQGAEYFLRNAVRFHSFEQGYAMATVSNGRDCEVDLSLGKNAVFVNCTCPYVERGQVCKHIWAALLAAQSRGFAGNRKPGNLQLILDRDDDWADDDEFEDERENDGPTQPASFHYKAPPSKPPKVNWEKQLDELTRAVQSSVQSSTNPKISAERRLIYVIDLPASQSAKKLVLEVGVQERKKDNGWSKPKAEHFSSSQLERLEDPTDRGILSLLIGAEKETSYNYYSSFNYHDSSVRRFRLSGPQLESVLPLLAESARVNLRTGAKPPEYQELIADLNPPWELALGVAESDTKKQWLLGGQLHRGDEIMDLAKATLLVPGFMVWEGRFGRLNDAGALSLVPILRREGLIAVPVSKSTELLQRLLEMPRLPKLKLPEQLQYAEVNVPPQPRLKLKAESTASRSYYRNDAHSLIAELTFDYDGQIVKANEPGRGVFQPEGNRFIVRDPRAERSAEERLVQLGARHGWSFGRQALEIKASQLPKIVRELVHAGWKVEAEGKLYRQPGEINLDIKTGQDWFDLSASVSFEGRGVTLPRLLAAISQGDSSVVLDDGSVGMVPEEWLKKYGLIARMARVEDGQIRFSKTQVGVLDALLASRPEVTFDEQFAQARDRLRQFEGVVPIDPPVEFTGELRGYQREGLGWLKFLRDFGFGGCLADDMGLGKTVQMLALLAGERKAPSLVVVPRSLIFNWKAEAAKFVPSLKVLDHTGQLRDRTGASFEDHDLILTTYGTLRNDVAAFSNIRFDTCVLDESQAAKNANTETAKAVRLINADHRLALSGTPVENHLGELWTLFDFLNPGMLGRGAFLSNGGSFRNPDPEVRDLLGKALRPFILRRTKDQVAKDLPAKTEQTVYCDLEGEQRELYDELREHYRQSLLPKIDAIGLKRSKIMILEALLRLRQAACHPGLLDKKRVKQASAKLDYLLPQLKEIIESGHKVLVFSQFTSLLSIVKSQLADDKIPYEYLDGRTRDRAARVERFQTDPECRLFLVSLKAGGVGLNLTAAEYVFLLDPWWNPAVEAQAIDRSHRIGQTKPVFAYRLIARGTVEEKVLALQKSKRELADAILGGDGRLITDLKREDLELLLS